MLACTARCESELHISSVCWTKKSLLACFEPATNSRCTMYFVNKLVNRECRSSFPSVLHMPLHILPSIPAFPVWRAQFHAVVTFEEAVPDKLFHISNYPRDVCFLRRGQKCKLNSRFGCTSGFCSEMVMFAVLFSVLFWQIFNHCLLFHSLLSTVVVLFF